MARAPPPGRLASARRPWFCSAIWRDSTRPTPLPPGFVEYAGFSQQELGVGIGWTVAIAVYLALAYMTFIYRWPEPPRSLRPDVDLRPDG